MGGGASHGVKTRVGRLPGRVVDAYYERRLRTVTSGIVEVDELGIADDPDRGAYGPTGWRTLPRVMSRGSVSRDDVFVDIGAGMGRAVLLAATRYRLRRVVGVEVAESLCEIARANVERNRGRLRTPLVEIVAADAATYQLPEDATIVYMHNPFWGDLFRCVAERILASVDSAPRPLRLIYEHPREHATLMEIGRFQPVAEYRRRWGSVDEDGVGLTRTYVVTGDGSARRRRSPPPGA